MSIEEQLKRDREEIAKGKLELESKKPLLEALEKFGIKTSDDLIVKLGKSEQTEPAPPQQTNIKFEEQTFSSDPAIKKLEIDLQVRDFKDDLRSFIERNPDRVKHIKMFEDEAVEKMVHTMRKVYEDGHKVSVEALVDFEESNQEKIYNTYKEKFDADAAKKEPAPELKTEVDPSAEPLKKTEEPVEGELSALDLLKKQTGYDPREDKSMKSNNIQIQESSQPKNSEVPNHIKYSAQNQMAERRDLTKETPQSFSEKSSSLESEKQILDNLS